MRTGPVAFRRLKGGSFSSTRISPIEISFPALSGSARRTYGDRNSPFVHRRVCLIPSRVFRHSWFRSASATLIALSRRAPLSESGGDQRSVSVNVTSWSTALSITM
jgi:hypothetical protein